MGFLLDVVVGGAIIALPKGNPQLLAATVVVQSAIALRNHRRNKRIQSEAQLPAEGGAAVAAAKLTFEHINCMIEKPKKSKTGQTQAPQVILSNVSGAASPGRLFALLGPSGSGKTSLLNALAGHVAVTKGMTLSGRVLVNGVPLARSQVRIGYVPQEDYFYSQMTVRETLNMVAALRLGRSSSVEDRDAAVTSVITKLGLAKSADTIVGDKKTRGLSGGEKKRLAIAAELISLPSILFLDEPTTGLDAFQAQQVMETLKELAKSGHTVVASIHQPRSTIFELFDDLMLLSEGRTVFEGSTEDVLDYFANLGHVCPQHYNPAEFLADLISRNPSTPELEAESVARVDRLVAAHSINGSDESDDTVEEVLLTDADAEEHVAHRKAPLALQTRLLLKRSWRQSTRDTTAIKLRIAANFQSAIVFGGIWWRLRKLQKSIPSRLGLLQVVAVYMSQSPLFKTLNLFPPEKNLVARERASGAYDCGPYFFSKVFSELPVAALYPAAFSALMYPMTGLAPGAKKFLIFTFSNILETLSASALGMAVGAVSPSTDSALVLGPVVMLVFVVFGGLYTNQEDVPKLLRWVPSASQVKRGFDTLCVNEFTGLELENEGPNSVLKGEDVLKRQGITNPVSKSLVGQGRILLFHYWLTFCILRAKVPRFQPMIDPSRCP